MVKYTTENIISTDSLLITCDSQLTWNYSGDRGAVYRQRLGSYYAEFLYTIKQYKPTYH